MKIYAVYDHTGEILAAVHMDQPCPTEQHIPPPIPVAQADQKVLEIDVPAEFMHLTFHEVCVQLRVDTKSRHPILIQGEDKCQS
jgi:hypothetical protein